jgi:CheY-like chemotaxis protein
VTDDERGQVPSGQRPIQERPRAVVVAVDSARLALYARTLRLAEVPHLATLDLGEAEQLLIQHQPNVLVLDYGLPRIYILRLYGLVREGLDGPRVKVLFVGQAGDSGSDGGGEGGSDDYYLPGEPSPLGVAAQVCEMIAQTDAAADATPLATADHPQADDQTTSPTGGEPVARPGGGQELALAGAAITHAPAEDPPKAPKQRRRLDVLMFRIGIVLLILGGLLAFIRPESFSLPMSAPPVTAPPTAAPTLPPVASPSPAAVLLPSGGPDLTVASFALDPP